MNWIIDKRRERPIEINAYIKSNIGALISKEFIGNP